MTEQLSPGTYRAAISKWVVSESSGKGTPQIVFTCKLLGKINKDGEEEGLPYADMERQVYKYLTEKTIERTAQDLRRLGYNRDDFDGLDPNDVNAFDFKDIEVKLFMKLEDYNGTEQERWDFAGAGAGGKPLERAKLSALNGKFAAALAAVKKAEVPPVKAKPPVVPAPAKSELPQDDEGIPF